MNHPDMSGLPERAAWKLLALFEQLSESSHATVGEWAHALADQALARLAALSVDANPTWAVCDPVPLSALSDAEVQGLLEFFADDRRAFHDDPDVALWFRRLVAELQAEPARREGDRMLADAQMATLDAELPPPGAPGDTTGIPPWSEFSRIPDDKGDG